MQFRLYLLNVSELEDDDLRQKALSLMDSYRRGKVNKYKIKKDRLHQIATGLLLQIGLLELEIPGHTVGEVYLCEAGEIVRILEDRVPIEAVYVQQQNGKPYWQQEFLQKLPFNKKFPFFSISHSGDYAALAIADVEMGLDIQMERPTRFKGGCQEFSRMEAYVKCTGDGYAKGYTKYKELNGDMPNYEFCSINLLPDYVIYLCHKQDHNNKSIG